MKLIGNYFLNAFPVLRNGTTGDIIQPGKDYPAGFVMQHPESPKLSLAHLISENYNGPFLLRGGCNGKHDEFRWFNTILEMPGGVLTVEVIYSAVCLN